MLGLHASAAGEVPGGGGAIKPAGEFGEDEAEATDELVAETILKALELAFKPSIVQLI